MQVHLATLPSGAIKHGWRENPHVEWKFIGKSLISMVHFPAWHVWLPEVLIQNGKIICGWEIVQRTMIDYRTVNHLEQSETNSENTWFVKKHFFNPIIQPCLKSVTLPMVLILTSSLVASAIWHTHPTRRSGHFIRTCFFAVGFHVLGCSSTSFAQEHIQHISGGHIPTQWGCNMFYPLVMQQSYRKWPVYSSFTWNLLNHRDVFHDFWYFDQRVTR